MSALDYHAQNAPPEFYQSDRVGVLFFMILHANIRNRCWPSMDRIVEKTKISKPTVIKAVRWLEEHGAILIVPFKQRVDDEIKLPPRLHVYQLTGVIEWEGETIRYLYFAPRPFNGDSYAQGKAALPSIVKSGDSKAILPKQGIDSLDLFRSTESEGTNNISAASKAAPNNDKFPPSTEVKNAFAIMCYGTVEAWKSSAKAMGKALTALSKYEKRSLTIDDLKDFRQWWKSHDWRGKQRQLPEPYTVTSVWVRFRAGENAIDAPLTELTTPKPAITVTHGKKRG